MQNTKDPTTGALDPTWEGLYQMVKVVRPETYTLVDHGGKILHHPWNVAHLRIYYH